MESINSIVDDIFKKIVKVKGFNISYKKLYTLLNQTKFEEKMEEFQEKNNMSVYKIFVIENLENGVELKNILDLWETTKKNKKEMELYKLKYKRFIN
tara:strand:+ start:228 stop:518 length:291 start_codon:yes stop_codon:yes gene_type:complete